MPRVPLKKNKNNYTVSAPRHLKKVTQHATSAKMHSQLAYGSILKQKKIYKDQIKKFFFTGGKTKSGLYYRGVKTY